MIVHALYENGVFRPLQPVEFPDRTEVEFEPRPVPAGNGKAQSQKDALAEIYAILSKRFNSGKTDTAERYNEHQP